MKHQSSILLLFLLAFGACREQPVPDWSPAPAPLTTPWTEAVDPRAPWPEYPRPQMERREWLNLNGMWEYAVLPRAASRPDSMAGEILVPYPIESALSGVRDTVGPDRRLWYRRTITIPRDWDDKRILLHFEAVDWEATVWLDDQELGTHRGGYDPFTFDLGDSAEAGGTYTLWLAVWDPSDEGRDNPRGKQVRNPRGIYYTPSTGIWQTVWMEPVPETYLEQYFVTPDLDRSTIRLEVTTRETRPGDQLRVVATAAGQPVAELTGALDQPLVMKIPDAHPWSPEDPFLYDLQLELIREGRMIDQVKGYFGLRKVALDTDEEGRLRIYLNNAFVFQNGPLDQGFWPDGIYTPPTEEAMVFDLKATKAMGFNMLRKHVKIENRRFYYWCDRLGLWVWQDMPSTSGYVAPDAPDLEVSEEHSRQFRRELRALIRQHYNHPSIIIWVPFNEGWGQHQTADIVRFIKSIDQTRLVNPTSGWADRQTGDIHDIHHYPDPLMPESQPGRAIVLGEFGGLGLPMEGHLWQQENWGYRGFSDVASLALQYEQYYRQVWGFRNRGLSAAVYTQTTDVETETNGLLTYDRRRFKMDTAFLRAINTNNFVPAPTILPVQGLFYDSLAATIIPAGPAPVYYTIDGSTPTSNSPSYLDRPVIIRSEGILKAVAIASNGKRSQLVSQTFSRSPWPAPTYRHPYSGKYEGGGPFALIDGQSGSLRLDDGNWQGFEGDNLEVIIDRLESSSIEAIEAGFLQDQRAWVFLPRRVEIAVSKDGKRYQPLATLRFPLAPDGEVRRETISARPETPVEARFIRLRARNTGTCPSWHAGRGGKAWIFIDEIKVE